MTRSDTRVLCVVVAAAVLFGLGTLSARAAPLTWQEKQDDKKEVKRVRIKRPCIIVSSHKKRGMLGVQLTDLTTELRAHFGVPMDAGVMVAAVTPDGPADKAGVRVGDIITSIDGEEVSTYGELARRIRGKNEGDSIELGLYRDKSPLTLTAAIEEQERSEVEISNLFTGDCDEFEFSFDFDEEAVRRAVENATRHLRSPEWRNQWRAMAERWREGFDEKEWETKLKELEDKVQEMEKELKELEKKNKSERK